MKIVGALLGLFLLTGSLLALAHAARAMLPAGGAVRPSDAVVVCRQATGCGAGDPKHRERPGTALGGLSANRTGPATTLENDPPRIRARAYFVAPGGSDDNSGALTAPFATVPRCAAAMATSDIKTCYIRAGLYKVTGTANNACFVTRGNYVWLLLDSSASNTTFSYYPPDGVGSAVIDGGASSPTTGAYVGICISDASDTGPVNNVTINGLTLRNFAESFIVIQGGFTGYGTSGTMIKNNTVYNDYTSNNWAMVADDIAPNTTFVNNYVYNVVNMAFGAAPGLTGAHPGGIDNLLWKNNIVENSDTACTDCGAFYLEDQGDGRGVGMSTGITIANNYCDGVNAGGGANCVYLDAVTSNVRVTGNVLIPGPGSNVCAQIHGGSNNAFKNNICDLANASHDGKPSIMFYQQNTSPRTRMTGNVWENNIIVCNMPNTPCGGGYVGNSSPPNPMTTTNNAYFNYGIGGSVNYNSSEGAGSDTNPIYGDPHLNCWTAKVLPSSHVFSSPVRFSRLGYAWGPPGLIGPSRRRVAPSWPHAC
jgi:hypothetical protein